MDENNEQCLRAPQQPRRPIDSFYWAHSGWIVDTLARNLSALVIFAEHRYWGVSNPFGPEDSFIPDAGHLGLLMIEQSMQDFAQLNTHLRDSLGAWDSPLVSVGGSLAGEISTWMRVRYPFIVDMALAGSAPILGYPGLAGQYTWYHAVTETFRTVGGDACVDSIRAGFWQVPLLSPSEITAAFNTCTPADAATAAYITGLVFGWAGGAAEDGYPASSADTPVHWACAAMQGAASGVAAFQAIINTPGQCLNITGTGAGTTGGISDVRGATRPRRRSSGARRALRPGTAPAAAAAAGAAAHALPLDTNGWDYMSCTEEVHPIGTNNVVSSSRGRGGEGGRPCCWATS